MKINYIVLVVTVMMTIFSSNVRAHGAGKVDCRKALKNGDIFLLAVCTVGIPFWILKKIDDVQEVRDRRNDEKMFSDAGIERIVFEEHTEFQFPDLSRMLVSSKRFGDRQGARDFCAEMNGVISTPEEVLKLAKFYRHDFRIKEATTLMLHKNDDSFLYAILGWSEAQENNDLFMISKGQLKHVNSGDVYEEVISTERRGWNANFRLKDSLLPAVCTLQ